MRHHISIVSLDPPLDQLHGVRILAADGRGWVMDIQGQLPAPIAWQPSYYSIRALSSGENPILCQENYSVFLVGRVRDFLTGGVVQEK